MPYNENGTYRGLHIVIINPDNGKVEFTNVFDTYDSSELLEQFINTHIPEGRIVVAAS